MSTLKVRTNLKMKGSVTLLPVSEFNPTPSLGETSFKDGILYIYSDINGLMTWYPMNRPQSSYVHSQGVESSQWVVNHGLGSSDVIVAAYDASGHAVFASIATNDLNTVTVTFTEAITGHAVVFAVEQLSAPVIQSESINASAITVNNEPVALESDVAAALDAMREEFNLIYN